MSETLRKASQEVEIDHLLAEEFACDPSFAERFLNACGLPGERFIVRAVHPEPSLGGEGYGDLLIEGEVEGRRAALLIEDKITAQPATRQAERYAGHASRMRAKGWHEVWTILVAPSAYKGERNAYDAHLALETVASLLHSSDATRAAYRSGIIERALIKRSISGVQVPDVAMYRLRKAYLECAENWCERNAFFLSFPRLKDSYYDGDSWVEHVRHRSLPEHIELRHRLWVSVKDSRGRVDLISKKADDSERVRFYTDAPDGSIAEAYSKGRGVQLSIMLPELRQDGLFKVDVVEAACGHMRQLISWYLGEPIERDDVS